MRCPLVEPRRAGTALLVVVAQLRDQQRVIGGLADEAVLVVDAARPIAGKRMPKRLGLPVPSDGVLHASFITALIRSTILLSVFCQYR